MTEDKWSDKYKKSIDCDNPKGFSQKAHCQGRKKKLKEMREDTNARQMYHKHFMAAMKAMPGSPKQAQHKSEMEKYKKQMGKSFINQVVPKKMAKFDKKINEDAPANAAGGGNVAGIGVGSNGEPGVDMKKRKRYKKGELLPFYAFMRRNQK